MIDLFDIQRLRALAQAIEAWLLRDVVNFANLAQIAAIVALFIAARFLAPRIQAGLAYLAQRLHAEPRVTWAANALSPLALPVCWLIGLWVAQIVAVGAGWPHQILVIAVSLLAAWSIIRLTSGLVRDPVWSRFIALAAWSVAALNILDLLQPTIAILDQMAINLGGLRISALTVIRGMIALGVLLWLAVSASSLLERRINLLPNLTPSVQVLFSKLLKIVLIVIAVVTALSSVGIDLTAFAVFSGAVGVGVGFGLQKVVSNLISGVILLMDRSIKPGDVISLGQTYGWIKSLGARYVSVVTRDGTEHLIPNEELITQRVENWSFSNNLLRLRALIGVAYHADVPKAMALAVEAAKEAPRVLASPEPVCLMKGFGDSSIDLELRFWINDPANGLGSARSKVLLLVWEKFRANGIEIPFSQRDLHLKSSVELPVVLRQSPAPADRR
ncbi:MAG: mechanosensitive ion channel [Rhodospirillales bacterium]|nr:mechanosensitive ion channel [Rhodospirillales bacterium]